MAFVLVAGTIHSSGLALLRRADAIRFEMLDDPGPAELADKLRRADGLLIRTQPLTRQMIAAAPCLKIVSRHGVGYDAVDVDALTEHRIPLTLVGDVNSGTVAEHTLFLMLAASRRALGYDRALREGRWRHRDTLACRELHGKTLLVVGYGRIGKRVGALAAAFGMGVLAFDPVLEAAAITGAGARPVASLAEGLAVADVITLHAPLSEPKVILGPAEFAAMKAGAVIVNASRGGQVDEAALLAALDEGRISAAGLDVFEQEPPAPDHPLLTREEVILSPHSAGLTEECAERMAVQAAENVLAALEGRLDPAFVVNRAVL